MEPPSLASPSLSSTSSSPLQGYLSSKDDVYFNPPPSTPPLDALRVPKCAPDTIDVAGPMAGDPSDSICTHVQTSGTRLLSHGILADPQSLSQVIGHLEWDRAMDEEYSSLMKNQTWDLCPLMKEES